MTTAPPAHGRVQPDSGLSRRTFLKSSGIAAAGTLAGSAVLTGQTGTKRERLALVGTGVRGTGTWGRDLVRDYADVVEIVGLCDINPGRVEFAREYLQLPNIPVFTDFDSMIEGTQPDRVIVTTMDSTHDQYIVRAMELGCDVLTEKPMTTDETKCQSIVDAWQRTRRDVVVTHNYRYSPHRQRLKQYLQEGRIGELTSVDFHWYLDIYHGASYFRRWHGKERSSGTLFVHKACHHFDLLNWWVDSDPEVVYGQGDLQFYGSNGPQRSTNCRPCPHKSECRFYWDITQRKHDMDLYVAHEHHDGYLRDGCVFSEEIDIFDKMAAQIRYRNGVQVSYSCTTYSPYEGYRIAFNGTEGRLEAWIKERQPWQEPERDELRLTTNFGETEIIEIPHQTGGHGGGDDRMRDRIFRDPSAPDPYSQAAGVRDGAMAVLIGFAARKSARSGEPVRISDLTSLEPQVVRQRA